MGKSGEGQNCKYLTVVTVPDNFIVRCMPDPSLQKLNAFLDHLSGMSRILEIFTNSTYSNSATTLAILLSFQEKQ